MDRLTTRENGLNREMICRHEDCHEAEEHCPHINEDNCQCLQDVLTKLAHYEDLAEQGRLVELPCRVGDALWIVGEYRGVYCEKVRTFFIGLPSYRGGKPTSDIQMIRTTGCDIHFADFGRTVFLTREEAEAKLAK